jgi:DNA mismatch repair ATPase MutS
MSKYHTNRLHEYEFKQLKHKEYMKELNKMLKKKKKLFKEVKSTDKNDGTVESYVYDPQMINMRSRLVNIDGHIRNLKKKVKRTF